METNCHRTKPQAARVATAAPARACDSSTMDGGVDDNYFPCKVWNMIDYCDTNDSDAACFHASGNGLVVKDERKLEECYLKRFNVCKTDNEGEDPKISAFYRQLTAYGFQKNRSEHCKYKTYQREDQNFSKGNKAGLKHIFRQKKTKKKTCSPDVSTASQDDFVTKAELVSLEQKMVKLIANQSSHIEKLEKQLAETSTLANKNPPRGVRQGAAGLEIGNKKSYSGRKKSKAKYLSGKKRLRFSTSPEKQFQLPRDSKLAATEATQATSSITTGNTTQADNTERESYPALPETNLKPVTNDQPIAPSATPLGTTATVPEPATWYLNGATLMDSEDAMTIASELTDLFGPSEDLPEETKAPPDNLLHEQPNTTKKRKQGDVSDSSLTLPPRGTVAQPSEDDVLCGEDDYSKHRGNRTFTVLVSSHKENYAAANLHEGKRKVCSFIVNAIRENEGRFLKYEIRFEGAIGPWHEMEDEAAIEMTMNALEEATRQKDSCSGVMSIEQSDDDDGDTADSGDSGGGAGSGDDGEAEHGPGAGSIQPSRQEGGSRKPTNGAGGSSSPNTFTLAGTAYGAATPGKTWSSKEEQDFFQYQGARASSCNARVVSNDDSTFDMLPRVQVYSALSTDCGGAAQDDFKQLIARVTNDKSLTKVVLRKNEIGPDEAEALSNALRFNTSIKCVDLWNNKIGDKGAMAIISSLCQNPSVKVLSLGQNNISAAGVSAIAKVFPLFFTAVVSLDLENNSMGVGGAVSLAMAVRDSASLKTLRLGGNGIEDKGAEAIAESIQYNRHISALYLERNGIGGKGAAAFANALQDNNVLIVLDLSENNIDEEGVMVLADALCQNTSLSTLGLRGNDFGNGGAVAIHNMLQKNKVVTRISVEHCGLSNEAKDSLHSYLKRNENATKVKDDKIALFKHLKTSSATRNSIAVLQSAPLVWKDDREHLYRIQDSHNFELEKTLLLQCVQKSKRDITLSFDVAVEGVLRAAAVAQCSCLHLSGHGFPGYLLFEDGMGGADWLQEDKLYEFVNEDTFNLVFVSGSSTVCTGNAFMKSGVQHVVCCEQSNTVGDEPAITFTEEFYSRLLTGSTISIAFERAKLAVVLRFGPTDTNKFMLLPENQDHKVLAFGSGMVDNYTEKVEHDTVSSYTQHQGQEIVLYQLIQLAFSQRVVNVVSSDTQGHNSLAMALFKYMSDRKSVLLDIDDVYYIPCDALDAAAEKGPAASVLQHYIPIKTRGTAGATKSEMSESVQKAIADLRSSKSLVILDDFSCESSWLNTTIKCLLDGTSDVKLLMFSRKGLKDTHPQLENLCEAVVLCGEIMSN